MARIYGLNGALRGRQGNNVFSIQNGTQVVKAYQPAVANPRTELQMLQRARFALAGKISADTPAMAIYGMRGASKRARRGSFVASIVGSAVASQVAGGYSASIRFADIIFSQGSTPRYSPIVLATAERSQASDRVIVASLPAMTLADGAPQGYGELVVVGIFDSSTSPLDVLQVKLRSTEEPATFSFRTPERVACAVAAWVIPFVLVDGVGGIRTSNLGVSVSNDSIVADMVLRRLVSDADYGVSEFTNAVVLPS